MNFLIITHHFPPEINGTATRAYEIIRSLLKENPNIRFFVVSPHPVRPFGKFHITYKYIQKSHSDNNKILIVRVWSYQPKCSSPKHIERILNYILFPIFSLPVVLVLSLISKMILIITPPTPLHFFTLLARMLGKKIVVDVTDLWNEEAKYLGYIRHSILLKLSQIVELISFRVANLISVASFVLAIFVRGMVGHKKRIVVLPTPFNGSFIKENNSLPEENLVIYSGNFGKPQALHLAIKAFAILNKEQTSRKIKLLLIGGGEEEESLRNLAKQLKTDNVIFLQPISREELFSKFFNQATVGLVPLAFNKALTYAIPTKLFEYLAFNLPFLSYGNSLELKRIASIFKAGIHIDVENEYEIARALQDLINHNKLFKTNTKKVLEYFASQSYTALKEIMKILE